MKQHLRTMEREHKANRLMNAERVMAGKPPILPRLPLSTGPFINHHLRSNSFPEWQHGRDVTFAIKFIFNHNGGWFGPTGYQHYYNNRNGTLKRIGALGNYLPYAFGNRTTDSEPKSVQLYNTSVNPVGQFIFKDVDISDKDLLNYR